MGTARPGNPKFLEFQRDHVAVVSRPRRRGRTFEPAGICGRSLGSTASDPRLVRVIPGFLEFHTRINTDGRRTVDYPCPSVFDFDSPVFPPDLSVSDEGSIPSAGPGPLRVNDPGVVLPPSGPPGPVFAGSRAFFTRRRMSPTKPAPGDAKLRTANAKAKINGPAMIAARIRVRCSGRPYFSVMTMVAPVSPACRRFRWKAASGSSG